MQLPSHSACGTRLEYNNYYRALSLGARWYCSVCNAHLRERIREQTWTIPMELIWTHKFKSPEEAKAWHNVAQTIKRLAPSAPNDDD